LSHNGVLFLDELPYLQYLIIYIQYYTPISVFRHFFARKLYFHTAS
jgi:hypothetical protein